MSTKRFCYSSIDSPLALPAFSLAAWIIVVGIAYVDPIAIRSQPGAYPAGGETFVVIASGNFGFIAGAVGGDTRIPEGGHLFVFKLRQDD